MPTVSVIVPNYNYAQFLDQRLQSILNQTYQDFEVLCLDDASTDNSREIISRYLSHGRFRVYYNEHNSASAFGQWHRGIELAQGEYIWIAEADDYADREFLSSLVAVLEAHPAGGLAYCQSWRVNEGGEIISSCRRG